MPDSARKRTRVAPGIYSDAGGFQAIVKRGRGPGNTKRFPAGTNRGVMRRWQRDRLAELHQTPAPKPAPTSQRGTIRKDLPAFLASLVDEKSRYDAASVMEAWLWTDLADTPRRELTRERLRRQLAWWRQRGVAASTVNKRLSRLRALFTAVDGEDAPNPTHGIKKFREPPAEPRGLTFELMELVLQAMPTKRYERALRLEDAKAIHAQATAPQANRSAIARAYGVSETMVRKIAKRTDQLETWNDAAKAVLRYRVMLYTGIPQAQIARIRPKHLDLEAHELRTTARRKGKGSQAETLPLLPEAVTALRAFQEAHCFGTCDWTAARRGFIRARDAVVEQLEQTDPRAADLLRDARPYDLRHTFLTEVYRASGDHRATGQLGLHADERTTRRYTLAAASERAQEAVRALERYRSLRAART